MFITSPILSRKIYLSKVVTNSTILQLHQEAWVRFVVLSVVMVGVYAIYGQYHADPSAEETIVYYRIPEREAR